MDLDNGGRRSDTKRTGGRRALDKVGALEHLPTRVCPFVPEYEFKLCEIKTCKNHSPITDCFCLAIDRVSTTGVKVISDAEITLFKFSDEKVTTRLVSMRRKEAVERVKCMLILKRYIDFIIEKYEVQGEDSHFVSGKYIQKMQTVYPLSTRRLNFKNWIWHYMCDEDVHNEFIQKQNGGECKEFKIEQLLRTTSLKYEKLTHEIKESTKQKQR
jgi:hypothetical protein